MSRLRRRLAWRYRKATAHRRCLPDFIIIGAQKSGTTSLYNFLAQHPQLLPSFRKEVHFFDGGINPYADNFKQGTAWYRAHFPMRGRRNDGKKTFEASPSYMFNPLVPRRIAELLPDVKMIALLRNPTERAISHYFDVKRQNMESLPIHQALQAEERRLELAKRQRNYKAYAFRLHSYKSRGLYREQLERYFRYFARQQILVLQSKELLREPHVAMRRLFEFVGVDPGFKVADLAPRNVGKDKEPAPREVYEYLNAYFEKHNRALSDLVEERFDW